MAKTKITVARPANVDPHEVEFEGWYQSKPPGSDEGFDWKTATWTETVKFMHTVPWSELNVVIAGVGVDNAGNITISGGVDISRFLLKAVVEEDRTKLASMLADPHRAVGRDYVSALVLFLVGAMTGDGDTARPTTP